VSESQLWPERLEIVTALPRNVTGKVLKRELVSQFRGRAREDYGDDGSVSEPS
jgi:acyl-CoA synthetase (AMP-forming)/AMP-acid ligase II